MEETLKRALVAVPLAAIVDFVTQWTDLVRVPLLVHADWRATASDAARPFSVAAVLLILIVLGELSKKALKRWSIGFVLTWIVLMIVCAIFNWQLVNVTEKEGIENAIQYWHAVFEVALAASVASAATVGLWLNAK